MQKIKIVEKVHICHVEKNSAQSDEEFRSYGHLKTADSYTLKNLVNWTKRIIGGPPLSPPTPQFLQKIL